MRGRQKFTFKQQNEMKKKSKNLRGNPVYNTARELQANIDKYFNNCETDGVVPTVCGIAIFLGFGARRTFADQAKRGPAFAHTIKRAKTRMLDQKFQAALRGKIPPSLFIFDAVNNHGMIRRRTGNTNDTGNI